MKSSYRSRLSAVGLSVLALCAVLSIAPVAHAEMESLRENVDLVPAVTGTTVDPALGGDASLNAVTVDGTTNATIEVSPEGLVSGSYNVTATLKSGTDSVHLGSFVIDSGTASLSGTDLVYGGLNGTPLPVDLNPFNVASVAISGTDGAPILVGDFTSLSDINNAKLHANLPLVSESAVPTASGHLVINAKIHHGKSQGLFNLVAHGLPGNATLSAAVNGTDFGTVYTDKQGNLHIIGVVHQNAKAAHGNGALHGHSHNSHNGISGINLFDIGTVSVHYPGGLDVLTVDL
jgi:hypothetical protein